jgi:hypothetical protein
MVPYSNKELVLSFEVFGITASRPKIVEGSYKEKLLIN